jgi:ABC-type phosphonate transport system ATPase subunit
MIRVENLTRYYHTLCAVDRISFTVQPGDLGSVANGPENHHTAHADRF